MKRYEITCSINPDDVLFETDVYADALTELIRRVAGSHGIIFEMYDNELTEAVYRSTPQGFIDKIHPTKPNHIQDWVFDEIDFNDVHQCITIKSPSYEQALKLYKHFRHPEQGLKEVILNGTVIYDHENGYL